MIMLISLVGTLTQIKIGAGPRARLGSRKTGLSPQYFNTDHSKEVLLLWFLTVTCFCCLYLYFGSAIMLVTYFSKF